MKPGQEARPVVYNRQCMDCKFTRFFPGDRPLGIRAARVRCRRRGGSPPASRSPPRQASTCSACGNARTPPTAAPPCWPSSSRPWQLHFRRRFVRHRVRAGRSAARSAECASRRPRRPRILFESSPGGLIIPGGGGPHGPNGRPAPRHYYRGRGARARGAGAGRLPGVRDCRGPVAQMPSPRWPPTGRRWRVSSRRTRAARRRGVQQSAAFSLARAVASAGRLTLVTAVPSPPAILRQPRASRRPVRRGCSGRLRRTPGSTRCARRCRVSCAELPPNTQGFVVLEMLNILEVYHLRAMGHNTTPYLHAIVEAKRLAFADREGVPGGFKMGPPTLASLAVQAGRLRAPPVELPRSLGGQRPAAPCSRAHLDPPGGAPASGSGDTVCPHGRSTAAAWRCRSSSRCSRRSLGPAFPSREPASPPRTAGACSCSTRVTPIVSDLGRAVHTLIPAMARRTGAYASWGRPPQPQGHVQALLNVLEFGMRCRRRVRCRPPATPPNGPAVESVLRRRATG